MFNNLGTAYEHLDELDEARDAFEKGAELGSVAAASSRKRLEGVDTIVVMTTEKEEVQVDVQEDETAAFDAPEVSEEPPEVVEEDDEVVDEPKVEESGVDAKVEDEATPEIL
jgi:hypothetical protein